MPNPTGGADFQVQGFDKVKAALAKLGRAAPKAAAAALKQEAETIMTDSKANYVPVEFGGLRESGHVPDPEFNGGIVSVELAFGGSAAPYALYVHEIPPPGGEAGLAPWSPAKREAVHTNGTWKYLEKPFKAAETGMSDRLAERLRNALIEGGGA